MILITFITALYFHKMFTASIRNCQEVPSGLVVKYPHCHSCSCGRCCGMGSIPGLRTFMSVAKK